LPAVQYEIENIKDKKLLVKFHNKLEYINGEQLEIMLTTKIFDKIHSKKSEMGTICIFELRITKGKRSNLRALLCGIEESKKNRDKTLCNESMGKRHPEDTSKNHKVSNNTLQRID